MTKHILSNCVKYITTSNKMWADSSASPTSPVELNEMYDKIMDVTDENEWTPYNETESRHTDISSFYSHVCDKLDDCLLYRYNRRIKAVHMSKPKDRLTAEYLAGIWKCGTDTARRTIEASTCSHYRSVTSGVTRRFRPARNFMRYR